uniref:Coagulation factor IX-like n=1 Tax=Callorhinchus milii TaxID=7868 RepID=A0A4W3I9W1_CALMI|eukprot:gi/632934237/ref/XP_007904276.1/ PREDICTED: coagulation factor IX-like [Callorhinchus milii]
MARCYCLFASLVFVGSIGGISSSVFLRKNEASRVLRIQKRSNWFWEETRLGSLERECYEELCSFEEAREIYKSNERTLEFWYRYKNLDPCQSTPCLNGGICKANGHTYVCLCPPLWKGKICEREYIECEYKNGFCQQYCTNVEDSENVRCKCAEGYQLDTDQRSCVKQVPYPCGMINVEPSRVRSIDHLSENYHNLLENDTDMENNTYIEMVLNDTNDEENNTSTKEIISSIDATSHLFRIIGGNICTRGMCPWQVLINDDGKYGFCGGSLISSYWVITAAHCFVTIKPHSITAGEYDKLRSEDVEQTVLVEKLVIHPQFDPITYDNDIALLYLSSQVNFNQFISPICLPNYHLSHLLLVEGQTGYVSGWGLTNERGRSSRFLRRVNLPYIEQETCIKSTQLLVTDNMFCAGYVNQERDSCKGDSGGPYAMNYQNAWYLTGLVSWGEGCAQQNKYGMYTRIPNYLSWIYESSLEHSNHSQHLRYNQ